MSRPGEDCEQCGRPMVIKLGKFGKFLACSGFPECRNCAAAPDTDWRACPTCGEGEIVERRSKKGRTFFGCERYPACDFVSWNKPVDRALSALRQRVPGGIRPTRAGQVPGVRSGRASVVADLARAG